MALKCNNKLIQAEALGSASTKLKRNNSQTSTLLIYFADLHQRLKHNGGHTIYTQRCIFFRLNERMKEDFIVNKDS